MNGMLLGMTESLVECSRWRLAVTAIVLLSLVCQASKDYYWQQPAINHSLDTLSVEWKAESVNEAASLLHHSSNVSNLIWFINVL